MVLRGGGYLDCTVVGVASVSVGRRDREGCLRCASSVLVHESVGDCTFEMAFEVCSGEVYWGRLSGNDRD